MNQHNPSKPYNNLPLLPPEFNFDDIDILKAVNKANKELATLKAALFSLPNPYLLIEPMTVREAVASSEIENINTTVAEIFQASLLPKSEITKPQKETLHYKEALLFGFQLVQEKKFLSTNSFIDIQQHIEPQKGGIRKLPGTMIKNTATGEILYTPPEGEELIRKLLKNYEEYFNQSDADQVDALIKMAVLHYQFDAIHPFYDGNGRTGRILIVLHIILQQLLHQPVLFISGYIHQHRSEYYRLLQAVTTEHQWKEWILFMLEAVRSQSKATYHTLLELKVIEEKLKSMLRSELRTAASYQCIEYLMSTPFYHQTHASKMLGMNRKTVAKYFSILEKKGFLKKFQLKRYTIYFNEELLRALQ